VLPIINQTMYINVLPFEPGGSAPTYRSRVADENDKVIFLEIPLDEKSRKYHRPQNGEQYSVFYFTAEGVKHTFTTTVQGVRKDSVTLVAVRKPAADDILREQRRSFLRVEAQLEIAVRVEDKLRFIAVTEDVGGGGLSFTCERRWPLTPAAKLSCWLLIPYRNGSIAHSRFDGEVVRVLPVEPDKHLIMMRFVDIADAEQQKIIRYCFERQMEFRKE
jgi:c-di-GMP-binding flagellar brake protein YcgR